MNEEVLEDLKQFIAATVSQQTSDLRMDFERLERRLDDKVDGLDAKINGVEQRLSKRIDDLTDFVSDAIDTANESADTQLKDHERRITKLEHAAA